MIQARFSPRRRIAFTLVELLVVIALILVIFGLGAGYIVYGQNNNHTVMASQAVTGAMLNAKQRARRDGLPTGIRILFSNNVASQLQLIQQPEDYNAGWCQSDPTDPNKLTVLFTGVDFLGGAATLGEADEATIQPFDYFVVAGTTVVHQIVSVNNPPNGFAGSLTLKSSPGTLAAGTAYTIIRAPRKLPSEDVISLPPTMVIDNTLGTSFNIPTSAATGASEILFAPSGGVVGQGTGANKILLWLRDPSQPTANGGSPLLVSIQVRTGSIEAYPVAPGPNWYSYANDPRYSGS